MLFEHLFRHQAGQMLGSLSHILGLESFREMEIATLAVFIPLFSRLADG